VSFGKGNYFWRVKVCAAKSLKSSGMANCSITPIVDFSGFLEVYGSIPIKNVVFFAFLGGVFAGGGWGGFRVQGSGIRGATAILDVADIWHLYICIVFVFFGYSRRGGPNARKFLEDYGFWVVSRCGARSYGDEYFG
jgi:hypothetical protein